MSSEAVGIETPADISAHDRRWAILQWLSVKLHDAPHGETLQAAIRFEAFVSGNIVGRQLPNTAISKINEIEPSAAEIGVGSAVRESKGDELAIPEWMDRR